MPVQAREKERRALNWLKMSEVMPESEVCVMGRRSHWSKIWVLLLLMLLLYKRPPSLCISVAAGKCALLQRSSQRRGARER